MPPATGISSASSPPAVVRDQVGAGRNFNSRNGAHLGQGAAHRHPFRLAFGPQVGRDGRERPASARPIRSFRRFRTISVNRSAPNQSELRAERDCRPWPPPGSRSPSFPAFRRSRRTAARPGRAWSAAIPGIAAEQVRMASRPVGARDSPGCRGMVPSGRILPGGAWVTAGRRGVRPGPGDLPAARGGPEARGGSGFFSDQARRPSIAGDRTGVGGSRARLAIEVPTLRTATPIPRSAQVARGPASGSRRRRFRRGDCADPSSPATPRASRRCRARPGCRSRPWCGN